MAPDDPTPPSISVSWSGTTVVLDRFPVAVGRDRANSVVIDAAGVSRRHVTIERDGSQLLVVDADSTNGTYVGGRRIQRMTLATALELRLGDSPTAPLVSVCPLAPERSAGALHPVGVGTVGRAVADHTVASFGILDGPTVLPRLSPGTDREHRAGALPALLAPVDATDRTVLPASAGPASARTTDGRETDGRAADTLTLHVGGRTHELQPGRERVIGRGPSCDIVVDHPLVSRRHAVVRFDGTAWHLDDLGSAHGTFVDGRRVATARLAGVMALWLGGADVGARAAVQTAGRRRASIASRLSGRRAAPVTLSLAVVAVLAGALALVRGPLRHSGAAPVSRLRQAAVRIRTTGGGGSGTLVSSDGLILTNAHVVAPDAVGQGVLQGDLHRSPPRPVGGIEVYVSRRPTESTGFQAVVVAVDGYLDLALVRVVATIDGAPLANPASLGLPHVGIAATDEVQQGTRLRVLGFPTIAGPSTVTLTEGTVSGFAADPRLRGAIGFVVTDALVGHGNSGGLAADERNRLVGVPTARRESNGDQVAVLRPAALALPMIEALHNGKPYLSPYTTDRRDEAFDALRVVAPSDRAGIEMACVAPTTAVTAGANAVGVSFGYQGFPADRQDLAVTVRRVGQPTVLGREAVGEHYPEAWHEKGCATVTITLDAPLAVGDHVVELWVGGNVVLTASAPLTVTTTTVSPSAAATVATAAVPVVTAPVVSAPTRAMP